MGGIRKGCLVADARGQLRPAPPSSAQRGVERDVGRKAAQAPRETPQRPDQADPVTGFEVTAREKAEPRAESPRRKRAGGPRGHRREPAREKREERKSRAREGEERE